MDLLTTLKPAETNTTGRSGTVSAPPWHHLWSWKMSATTTGVKTIAYLTVPAASGTPTKQTHQMQTGKMGETRMSTISICPPQHACRQMRLEEGAHSAYLSRYQHPL